MKPVIKAKRWWWLPDRKKAKLANKVMQYQMNKELESEWAKLHKMTTIIVKVNKDGTSNNKEHNKHGQ